MDKVCRLCKRIIEEGNECVVCGSKDLTRSWKGVVVILNTDCEIAKKAELHAPGKYAIQVY